MEDKIDNTVEEKIEPGSSSPEPENALESTTKIMVDEKKLIRKIDLHVMPILFLIYLVAFLDRVNISNALTMGLPKELGLTGEQPNVALTVFFVPYVLFEVPSNICLKKFQPHVWLPICISVFGLVMLCQGFVHSYGGLIATRFFLGLAEAGIFPGSFYLISFWYRRDEAQKRFTVYWSSVITAGAFGGLLASAISKMNGIRGLSNWRWLFILEGIASILVGILAYFTVTDFPAEARWLTPEEKEFVVAKTQTDESHKVAVTTRDVLVFFQDIKVYLAAIMYFAIVVPIYAFAFFTPTIVQSLGYPLVQTQLHSIPPFAAALGLCLLMAYLSDRTDVRFPFILLGNAFLITGLAILLGVHGKSNFSAEYLGICFVCMGGFGAGASIVCWYLMNLHGHVQRSIGSAWMIGFGNIGGIVATFTFIKADAPYYTAGYWTLMAVALLGLSATFLYAWEIWKEKRRASQAGEDAKFQLSL